MVNVMGTTIVNRLCLLGIVSVSVWIGCPLRARAQATPPNVLFIAVDDLNDWIGCLGGHPQTHTPNMDRLAARGMLFANAHCAAPACNPSRAALFSGRWPQSTGVWSNSSPKIGGKKAGPVLLPSAFQAAGYATVGTGKLLHGGGGASESMLQRSYFPEQRWSPFAKDEVKYTPDELPSKGTSDPRHVIQAAWGEQIVLPLNRMPSDRNPHGNDGESFDWGPFDIPDDLMGDTQITNWSIEQLEGGFDKPFFLAVGYYRPHIPLWAPRKYFERWKDKKIQLPPTLENDLDDLSDVGRRWAIEAVTAGSHATTLRHGRWEEAVRGYLACITFVDHQIGRLLDVLDASPYADNTLIVMWSDHGWHLGEKQHWGKWTGWERSTRVPLIIVPPKSRAARFDTPGTVCRQPVSLIDLYPTLTQLCGVDAPPDLAGTALTPLLKNAKSDTGRIVLTTFDRGNLSMRTATWRYVRYDDGSEELYNLEDDPHEWDNVVARSEYAEPLRRLRREARRVLAEQQSGG